MKSNAILIKLLKGMVWASKEERDDIEKSGIKISPSNFYSSIPSINEIETSYEYTTSAESQPPYSSCDIFSDPIYSSRLLEELTIFSNEYSPPEAGSEESPAGYFWSNSQFSHSDAMSYYTFIRHIQPKKIVEIGSGFSTLVAIDALNKNEMGQLVCIEPYPRPFLEKLDEIDLVKSPAQEITPEWLNDTLNDGDVLFIDSTHTVKTGSDCLHIYLRLLPEIKRDVYIHVHDVFLPFGLPKAWLIDHHIYWTEQYLLLAFLIDNPKVTFLYGSSYHLWANEALLTNFMHGRARAGGGSFWFKYSGSDNS